MNKSKFGLNTPLARALKRLSLDIQSASKFSGIAYQTIYQHCIGKRKVSPYLAIKYEETLKIPRSELRPDLWPTTKQLSQESVSSNG